MLRQKIENSASSPIGKSINSYSFLGIIFVFYISLYFRLFHLGYHDFWFDEISTINGPWQNFNAPIYFVFIRFWIRVFGFSEFSLRFPSLIFSFLSIVLLFFLGRYLFNRATAIVASLLMGLSPFHLWYAQEARYYSMVLFFGTMSSYFLFKAYKTKGIKWWILFVLVSATGFYTNYFYGVLFLTQLIWFILIERFRLNFKAVACFLLIAALFLPHLNKFFGKFFYVWEGFWLSQPTWRSLFITVGIFLLGYNGLPVIYRISCILAGIFIITSLWNRRSSDLKKNIETCLFFFLIPIAGLYIFSITIFPVYLYRGLIIFSPYFYLIVAVGIVSLKRTIRTGLVIAFISLLLVADYGYFKDWIYAPLGGTYAKKPFKPLAKFLNEKVTSADIIAFTIKMPIMPLLFYTHGIHRFYCFFDPKIFTPDRRPMRDDGLHISLHNIQKLRFSKLWVVYSNWERNGNLDSNSQAVKNWLDKNLNQKSVYEFDGLWVFVYER